MKKIIVFISLISIFLCLFGCAKKEPEEPLDPAAEAQIEEPWDVQLTDEDLVNELKKALDGEWTYSNLEQETLTFHKDGTGHYNGIHGQDLDFTYKVVVEHREWGNGTSYVAYVLYMNYADGASEEMLIFSNDDFADTFGLHNYEDGGYMGILNFNEYQRRAG